MFFHLLEAPESLLKAGLLYVASYYLMAIVFNYYNAKPNYYGIFRKGTWFDNLTSLFWCLCAILLMVGLIETLALKIHATTQNSTMGPLDFRIVLTYYFLFIFAFSFIYNLLDWHFPGMIDQLSSGWEGELQCLILSIQVFAGGSHTTVKPKRPLAELVAGIQTLLGVLFVAVFIAIAVGYY